MDSSHPPLPPATRRIFANRTLNLRSIRAIGFDMDYTLVHYRTADWERRVYEHVRDHLAAERRWPLADLRFVPELVTVGLVVDIERGNIVKANRFGYVKRASHGTRMLSYDEQRRAYSRDMVNLDSPRWVFVNTLFALSETCLYAQLTDLLDAGLLGKAIGYADLYRIVRSSIDEAHMEGALKDAIMADPSAFVVPDPELPVALQDLRNAGKTLLLITNSGWAYTNAMMRHAFDPHLPQGVTWRDLFHLVVVSARKPDFFTTRKPIFEVVSEDGTLRPKQGPIQLGNAYLGGNAGIIERDLDMAGDEFLYVGDHIFADVHVSKNLLRWRTALVVRVLEQELEALRTFAPKQRELSALMDQKNRLEHSHNQIRVQLMRMERGYGPVPERDEASLRSDLGHLRQELDALDDRIAPLAKEGSQLVNMRWGLPMRAGNDKSHLARQIERYADVYMSRVSNLLEQTPFAYTRSARGSLPHDSGDGRID